MVSLLFLALSSFALALALTPLFRDLSRKLGWFDHPDHARKLHPRPVPRIGGAPIVLSYLASFALLMTSPLAGRLLVEDALPVVWNLVPAVLIVFATGLADDLVGLKPWQKFAGQFVAAGLACSTGLTILHLGAWTVPLWLGIPLTVLWLAACSNAFNLIDGVDGLSAGIGLFATVTTLLSALITGHIGLALATAPLAGALLAFLRFNSNPASVFLGDCGSLTIGFLLGCYALIWSHKTDTLFGLTAPLMALSVPLLDTALAIGRRLIRGRPVFAGDRGHIHHKLLDRGFTPRRVAFVLYGLCGIAAAFSLIESISETRTAGAVIVVFCLVVWLSVRHLGYVEFDVARRMMVPSAFARALNAQVRLRLLENDLLHAADVDRCWDVLCEAARDLRFARVAMRLASTVREERLHVSEPSAACWMLRIPLSDTDYINIAGEFGTRVPPLLPAGFAGVIRRTFEARLPALRGEPVAVVPEPAPAIAAAKTHAAAAQAY
jgi:UDP-GlcNAc:undecaprenyl-phosphate/decaprenyl-phosphate GlcNAc-1-phosphate transferase